MSEREEVVPPWVQYPEYGPGDGFWRQTGEAFMSLVWKPFYESLSENEQENYLARWNVPEVWQDFYFDKKFQAWLESTDEND